VGLSKPVRKNLFYPDLKVSKDLARLAGGIAVLNVFIDEITPLAPLAGGNKEIFS
jgi:hypothetical protein